MAPLGDRLRRLRPAAPTALGLAVVALLASLLAVVLVRSDPPRSPATVVEVAAPLVYQQTADHQPMARSTSGATAPRPAPETPSVSTSPSPTTSVPHATAIPNPTPNDGPTTPPPSPPADQGGSQAGYGCAAALSYLAAHAAPGFTFECPGNAMGRQAMTCAYVANVCPDSQVIAIADPCPAAYMNEAYNSRVAEGLATGPFDPYGYCPN